MGGGEVADGLVGQLGGQGWGRRPVWAVTSILAATGKASWPSHTMSDRTFGTPHRRGPPAIDPDRASMQNGGSSRVPVKAPTTLRDQHGFLSGHGARYLIA